MVPAWRCSSFMRVSSSVEEYLDVASWKGMQACSNEEALRYLIWSMSKAFWEIFGLRLADEDDIKRNS